MDDKFTLKEIVTMYFWVKDKNFGWILWEN